MNVKTWIIICIISFIIGAISSGCITGFIIHKIASVSMAELKAEKSRIDDLNKQITGQLQTAQFTITELEKRNINITKYYNEFEKSNEDDGRIIFELARINKSISETSNKY